MSRVTAVFRHGVFEPLEPVALAEEQRVQLSYEPADQRTAVEHWLESVRDLHTAIAGTALLPDSTAEIAADRLR